MQLSFVVTTAEEYFKQFNFEIDWDEVGGVRKVSIERADKIQEILACEIAIHLMRRNTGFDDSPIDSMIKIRRGLIEKYNENGKYKEFNDFY